MSQKIANIFSMRWKANRTTPQKIDDQSIYLRPLRGNSRILRIIDQTLFDFDNDGGCQSAALFSAIEAKFGHEISYQRMRECYLQADAFWFGKTEKLSRIMRFMKIHGFDFGFGKIKVVDYSSFDPIETEFDQIQEACQRFDFVGVALRRNSPFFSDMTGNLYNSLRLPVGHAMRVIESELDNRIIFVNSYGQVWGKDGCGIVRKDKFPLLRFSEIRMCDFVIEK